MKLLTRAIVSNSKMIKNYKDCREKADGFGKIFVLKNNQPDAVLFSITEYERLSVFIEYLESLEEKDIAKFTGSLPKEENRKTYTMDDLKDDKTVIVSATLDNTLEKNLIAVMQQRKNIPQIRPKFWAD